MYNLYLKFIYYPQHFVLIYSQFMFLPLDERPSFSPTESYVIFSILLSLLLFKVQIFSSILCSRTFSKYVLTLG
jgi:hypothetical protein